MKVTRYHSRTSRTRFGFVCSRAAARVLLLLLLAGMLLAVTACGDERAVADSDTAAEPAEAGTPGEAPELADPGAADVLPPLEPVTLGEGERLRVVATTSIVADVARRVGGEAIEVITLMPLGVDPHSYTPTPQDIRTLNDAHLILINGLGLEEALMPLLSELESPVPVVSVNAGIAPLTYGEGTEEEGAATQAEAEANADEHKSLLDPHTWLSVKNMLVWVDNVAASLAALDAANVNTFFTNASTFQEELNALHDELRKQIDTLPNERRKLVTDHQELNYFAQEYGFDVIGAAIPGVSTMVAPSAQDLAGLQDEITAAGVGVIFVGANVDDSVVNQLATDLDLEIVELHVSSLTEADGPAPDYATMMRYNVNAIVAALAE